MIRFACPSCSAAMTAANEQAGKSGRCPECQSKFVIPSAPAEPGASVEIKPCPGCKATLTVSPGDVGIDVECPHCKEVFQAVRTAGSTPVRKTSAPVPADDDDRPRRPRRDEEQDDDRPRRRRREEDDDEVDDRPPRRRRDDDEEEEEDDRPRIRRKRRSLGRREEAEAAVAGPAIALIVVGIIALVISVLAVIGTVLGVGNRNFKGAPDSYQYIGLFLGFIYSIVVIFSGMKMKSLTGWGSAITGVIFAMLPCHGCCLLGLPIGIWALVVLMRPEVKESFR